MNRRWMRIDPAHPTFDCSASEFEAILNKARSESATDRLDRMDHGKPFVALRNNDSQASIVPEAINAALAELATCQRRERFMRSEGERSKQDIEQRRQGQLLADLHAAALRPNP